MAGSFVNLLRGLEMKLSRQEASVVETKAQIAELAELFSASDKLAKK